MSDEISFTIDEDLLDAAGIIVAGEKSSLSLIGRSGKTLTENQKALLRTTGIVDGSGRVKEEFRHVMETLARTRSFARLKYSAGKGLVEFIVFFPTDNSKTVSLIHNNNQFVVNEPSSVKGTLSLMDQNIGHSQLASCSFSAEFSQYEALSLFALMDLERSTLLHKLADGFDPENVGFDRATIINHVTKPKVNFQSLEYVLQSRLVLPTQPTPEQIENGLTLLANKGFVRKEGMKFQLVDALYEVAGRFLIMDSFVVVETGKLDQKGTMHGGSFISMQAGLNDLLYIECHYDGVFIKCITGFEILGLIGRCLSDPDSITLSPAIPESPGGAPASRKFCPQCGTAIQPNKKFCPQCGAKFD